MLVSRHFAVWLMYPGLGPQPLKGARQKLKVMLVTQQQGAGMDRTGLGLSTQQLPPPITESNSSVYHIQGSCLNTFIELRVRR
jgi:hypothetical protein